MGIYRDLVRIPGVARVVLAQLTARLPFGMVSIILLLHIQQIFGNYASAGLVLAVASIGQAVSGPLSSRLMGRFGMRRVLIATTLVCTAMFVLIALTELPLVVITVIALLLGLTTPPITPAVRTIYPKMVPGNRVSALYSLDAAAQEFIWVLGPVLAVFAATQISTTWGLLIAAGFLLAGGLWFVLSPESGRFQLPRSRKRLGAVLRRPTVIVSTVLGFLLVTSFAALEAGIVSWYGHDGIEAGIILGIFSVGSIIGGLLIGHRDVRPWSLAVYTLILVIGTALSLVSFNAVWLSVVLFFGGLGVAPILAALFTIVSAEVKFSETAEAFGWVGTGQLVGLAAGSAVAGVAIDAFGSIGGIIAATGFVVIAGIAALISMPWIPDMRGRESTPRPDTEPIQLIP